MTDTKKCQRCGREFERPYTMSQANWAKRRFCGWDCYKGAILKPGTCPICGEEFRKRSGNQVTCRRQACIDAFRNGPGGEALSERMRADYAAGKRRPAAGTSPREVALWPLLREHGWLWRLRWIEAPQRTVEFDFALLPLKLAVEIDGPEHQWKRKKRSWPTDAERDAELSLRGWLILRIPNADVDADVQAVADRVLNWASDSRA